MGETVLTVLKWSALGTIVITFMAGVSLFINFFIAVVVPPVVREVFGVISCCLPFNASAVFSSILTAITTIGTFLALRKVFNLSTHVGKDM